MRITAHKDHQQPSSSVAHWGGLIAFLLTVCVVFTMQHQTTPAIMGLAFFLSKLGNEIFLSLGCLILIASAIRDRSRDDVTLTVSTVLLVTVVVHAVKLISGLWLDRPSGSAGGFPSGHAATSFALAFLLSARFPKLAFVWYASAIGISSSRVLLGAHYPYQVFVGAIIGCCLAICLNGRLRTNIRIETAAHRYHWLLMSIPLIVAVMSFSYESENDLFLLPATAIFFISGFILRVWVRKHIWSAQRKGCHLCTTGPYAILRHPAYLGNILICIGVTISTEVIWLLPLTIIFGIAVYGMAARVEERDLLNRYISDYEDYTCRVRRWVPRISLSFPRQLATTGWATAMVGELSILLLIVPAFIKELIS